MSPGADPQLYKSGGAGTGSRYLGLRESNQALAELKTKLEFALSRLNDQDTQRTGVEEIREFLQTLYPDWFPMVISCIGEAGANLKPLGRCESVKLLGMMAELHGETVVPLLQRILQVVVARLQDADLHLREACAETVFRLAQSLVLDGVEGTQVFAALLKPLFNALGEHNKTVQIGAAACICQVIQGSPPLVVRENLGRLCSRLCQHLNLPLFVAKPQLLSACVYASQMVEGAEFDEVLPSLMPCLENCLAATTDWQTRKQAVEVLQVVGDNPELGASLDIPLPQDLSVKPTPLQRRIAPALEALKGDKVRAVREAAKETLLRWSIASKALSMPTSHTWSSPAPNAAARSTSPAPGAAALAAAPSTTPAWAEQPPGRPPQSEGRATTARSLSPTPAMAAERNRPPRSGASSLTPQTQASKAPSGAGLPEEPTMTPSEHLSEHGMGRAKTLDPDELAAREAAAAEKAARVSAVKAALQGADLSKTAKPRPKRERVSIFNGPSNSNFFRPGPKGEASGGRFEFDGPALQPHDGAAGLLGGGADGGSQPETPAGATPLGGDRQLGDFGGGGDDDLAAEDSMAGLSLQDSEVAAVLSRRPVPLDCPPESPAGGDEPSAEEEASANGADVSAAGGGSSGRSRENVRPPSQQQLVQQVSEPLTPMSPYEQGGALPASAPSSTRSQPPPLQTQPTQQQRQLQPQQQQTVPQAHPQSSPPESSRSGQRRSNPTVQASPELDPTGSGAFSAAAGGAAVGNAWAWEDQPIGGNRRTPASDEGAAIGGAIGAVRQEDLEQLAAQCDAITEQLDLLQEHTSCSEKQTTDRLRQLEITCEQQREALSQQARRLEAQESLVRSQEDQITQHEQMIQQQEQQIAELDAVLQQQEDKAQHQEELLQQQDQIIDQHEQQFVAQEARFEQVERELAHHKTMMSEVLAAGHGAANPSPYGQELEQLRQQVFQSQQLQAQLVQQLQELSQQHQQLSLAQQQQQLQQQQPQQLQAQQMQTPPQVVHHTAQLQQQQPAQQRFIQTSMGHQFRHSASVGAPPGHVSVGSPLGTMESSTSVASSHPHPGPGVIRTPVPDLRGTIAASATASAQAEAGCIPTPLPSVGTPAPPPHFAQSSVVGATMLAAGGAVRIPSQGAALSKVAPLQMSYDGLRGGVASATPPTRKTAQALWDRVVELCKEQRYLEAYKQVIAEPEETCLLKLMQHTGPIVEHLDAESNSRLIRRLIHILSSPSKDSATASIDYIFGWLRQALKAGIHFTASQVEDLVSALQRVASPHGSSLSAEAKAEAEQLLVRVAALRR